MLLFYTVTMLTATSAFALFMMLALASVVYYIAGRFRLPYTVLLTLVGVFLVPLSSIDAFGFIRDFQLTPELLFFIFLPTLLFESAYNMPIRRVADEVRPILLLAVVGYLVSAFLIGGGLWLALGAFGLSVPFLVTLLFGALISATDPVAVLALFKEYGAPRRLTLLFEGESLANDATALALFVVILGLIEAGITSSGIFLGGVTFLVMLLGGAVLGMLVGAALVNLIGFFRKNEVVAVTLMIVLAHVTFLIAEIANEGAHSVGIGFIQFSPIVATTVASLFMGNYGRFKVSPRAEAFVDKFWEQFAFMANSVVFILVGLLFASIPGEAGTLIIPTLIAIGVVALARAFAIYGTVLPFNAIASVREKIPLSWTHLLAWGSLRGALAVMIVLLIPAHLTVPGWTLDLSVQQFLLVLTVGCIFATLFVKAPTIGPLIRGLKVDRLTTLEKIAEQEGQAIIHGTTMLKVRTFAHKGYIPEHIARDIIAREESLFQEACRTSRGEHSETEGILAERALRLYTIGLEKQVLNELYAFEEVTERVFKQIRGKLTIQAEALERGEGPDASVSRDARDLFENLAEALRSTFVKDTPERRAVHQFLYYRGQQILARKVVKELTAFQADFPSPIFNLQSLSETIHLYDTYKQEAKSKLDGVRTQFPAIVAKIDEELAFRSTYRVKEKYLERLRERELLTPKLYIKLRDEYEEEVARHRHGA